MATVFLGNTSPRNVPEGTQVHVNDEHVGGDQGEPVQGKTIVVIETPDFDAEGKKVGIGKKLLEIKNAFRVHSVEGVPAWVEAHDQDFAQTVADEFGCDVGRPEDWDPKQEESAEEPREAKSEEGASFTDKTREFLADDPEVQETVNES